MIVTDPLVPTFAPGGQGWVDIELLESAVDTTWCKVVEVDASGRNLGAACRLARRGKRGDPS